MKTNKKLFEMTKKTIQRNETENQTEIPLKECTRKSKEENLVFVNSVEFHDEMNFSLFSLFEGLVEQQILDGIWEWENEKHEKKTNKHKEII